MPTGILRTVTALQALRNGNILNNMKFLEAKKAQHQVFLQLLILTLIHSEHWKFNRDQQKPKAVRLEM